MNNHQEKQNGFSTKEITEMIKEYKDAADLLCLSIGHDYQEVDGIEGKICVCCGRRPGQKGKDVVSGIKKKIGDKKH